MTTPAVHCPAFLKRFSCLGAECEDTCCKGWSMQVDEETYARYQQQAPAITEAVTGDAGGRSMRRDAKTDYCVKFEGGLCGIQKQYGTDFLSDACHFYPRMTRSLGTQVIMTAALSCPEIARLMLFGEDAFTAEQIHETRLPHSLQDYLPADIDSGAALALHNAFVQTALDGTQTPSRNYMRIISAAQSLERISLASWPEAGVFYLARTGTHLPAGEAKPSDPFFLLQALCGLVAAARKAHQTRLMEVISTIEQALHCSIRWDNLAIAHLPDSAHAAASLQQEWQERWAGRYGAALRRYLGAQMSLALFPFGGFGGTLSQRAAIIGVRFATVRLALMSACRVLPQAPGDADCVRIVQSLSRLLDHLAEPEFSLNIYRETGWLDIQRLRALTGDI